MLLPLNTFAGPVVEAFDKGAAILNKRWNDCIAQNSNETVYKCLRPTAIAAAKYKDDFVKYHLTTLKMRPDGQEKANRLITVFNAGIEYVTEHCNMISVLAEEREDRQKAYCHFQLSLNLARTMALYLEDI